MVTYVRVKEGAVKPGQKIRMMHTKAEFAVVEVGYLRPGGFTKSDVLEAGEVGYSYNFV